MRYDTGVQTLEIAGTVFTLRDVGPSDCTAVLGLHRRVFGSTVDAAWFDWKYRHGGGEAVGLWQGNELVAHCGGTPRTVAATYSAEILDGAVRASARGELDREAFLDKLAAAGISTYEARLGDRVIVYEGHGQSYAESIYR